MVNLPIGPANLDNVIGQIGEASDAMSTNLRDVAIIGSGFAGSLIANSLAQAGMDVVLIEAGLPMDDETHARQRRRETFANSDEAEVFAPYTDLIAPQDRGYKSGSYIQEAAADRFEGQYMRLTGGTGLAWLGTALRMCPNDFLMQTMYGRGRDWPVSYDDLEPWYCAAEEAIGVAGSPEADTSLNSSRSKPFPMPAIPQSYADKYVIDRIGGLHFDSREISIVPTPQARNSVDGYNGRPLCEGYSSCVPLCPAGAKYDPLVHLRLALLNGAELLAGSAVSKLDASEDGRITSAWFETSDGSTGRVQARAFVLAANGIETPRLLLQSNHQRAAGLANESGLVGRNLMDHVEKHSWAIVPDQIFPYRGPQSTSGIELFRDGPFRRDRAAFRTALRNDGWRNVSGAPFEYKPLSSAAVGLLELVDQQHLIGEDLFNNVHRLGIRQFALQSVVEMLPDPANRVALSSEIDRLGLPRPKIQFRLDKYSRHGIAAAARLHREIFRKLGCNVTDIGIHIQDDRTASDAGGSHIMGTTVMGNDPTTSVVDANCTAHHHRNLFVAGSAVFPTGAAANPTLTICALSLRLAQHLKATMRAL
ncbi:GMC family oxidoreductase [Sinorhizobium sp. 7-81]|uniref:GMC family oxidoreductase n=1 Tax=Sinorhizobium sp. 8-89 TaxID=3049089 RepID=UPI0024C3FDC1|nr:GMC family oxidoreductase [Sinorhizobium sp. 8-89]MDK1494256.1 GMC family oxidoreductase [Sinorhizobium sp. 8-89]